MIVRPAKEEDLPALLEIYNYEVIHGTATLDLNQRTLPEWKEWFREHQTKDHFILTAEIDGVTAGYASLSETAARKRTSPPRSFRCTSGMNSADRAWLLR